MGQPIHVTKHVASATELLVPGRERERKDMIMLEWAQIYLDLVISIHIWFIFVCAKSKTSYSTIIKWEIVTIKINQNKEFAEHMQIKQTQKDLAEYMQINQTWKDQVNLRRPISKRKNIKICSNTTVAMSNLKVWTVNLTSLLEWKVHHLLLEWPYASNPSGTLPLGVMKNLAFLNLKSYNEDNIKIKTRPVKQRRK